MDGSSQIIRQRRDPRQQQQQLQLQLQLQQQSKNQYDNLLISVGDSSISPISSSSSPNRNYNNNNHNNHNHNNIITTATASNDLITRTLSPTAIAIASATSATTSSSVAGGGDGDNFDSIGDNDSDNVQKEDNKKSKRFSTSMELLRQRILLLWHRHCHCHCHCHWPPTTTSLSGGGGIGIIGRMSNTIHEMISGNNDRELRYKLIMICIVSLLLFLLLLLHYITIQLFGHYGSIHGGLIGSFIDTTIRTCTFRTTLHQRNQEVMNLLGYTKNSSPLVLPELAQENINKRGLPVLTQTYLATTLINTAKRNIQRRQVAEQYAIQFQKQQLQRQRQLQEQQQITRNQQEQQEAFNKDTTSSTITSSSSPLFCQNQKPQTMIPKWILQPNMQNWYRPFRITINDDNGDNNDNDNDDASSSFELLEFDESEMRQFIKDHFPKLQTAYDAFVTHSFLHLDSNHYHHTHRNQFFIQIWALCALYWYGGYFVSSEIVNSKMILKNNQQQQQQQRQHLDTKGRDLTQAMDKNMPCLDFASITFRQGNNHDNRHDDNNNNNNNNNKNRTAVMEMIQATPRHPDILCAIQKLETNLVELSSSSSSSSTPFLFNNDIFTSDYFLSLFGIIDYSKATTTGVGGDGRFFVASSCSLNNVDTECCKLQPMSEMEPQNPINRLLFVSQKDNQLSTTMSTMPTTTIISKTDEHKNSNNIIYNILERRNDSPLENENENNNNNNNNNNNKKKKVPKVPISQILSNNFCQAGWLCNRCLKTSWFGTFGACSLLCSSCYVQTICMANDTPERTTVRIDVVPSSSSSSSSSLSFSVPMATSSLLSLASNSRRIPRIIHQTWFEDVTLDKYPHLVRLQNSWKRSGWDYRFYNDDSARNYIQQFFPHRFLDAFDAIIPGAFKADFFRLLLLLREGGIYVDADVKLDVDLDHFVTPNLGFFAPRDFIAGYDNGCYCFWNGFIGAEPGHPFIAKAVERMLDVVLNRGDYYDIEREVCRASPDIDSTEVWKLRALDILTLTGPCALGISMNKALGRGNLAHTFDIGWFQPDDDDDDNNNNNNKNAQHHLKHKGDILFLMPDKYDMGEFRFTDMDRNLLVASTEHTMFLKKPLEPRKAMSDGQTPPKKTLLKAHYSSQEHISDIFGEHGVYIDNLVTNEVHEIYLHLL